MLPPHWTISSIKVSCKLCETNRGRNKTCETLKATFAKTLGCHFPICKATTQLTQTHARSMLPASFRRNSPTVRTEQLDICRAHVTMLRTQTTPPIKSVTLWCEQYYCSGLNYRVVHLLSGLIMMHKCLFWAWRTLSANYPVEDYVFSSSSWTSSTALDLHMKQLMHCCDWRRLKPITGRHWRYFSTIHHPFSSPRKKEVSVSFRRDNDEKDDKKVSDYPKCTQLRLQENPNSMNRKVPGNASYTSWRRTRIFQRRHLQ